MTDDRYSRHVFLKEIGAEGQSRIAASRVFVIGAGGVGCPAALALVESGIASLTIADVDAVDLSNLPRQILHTPDRIGMNKAQSAAIALRTVNPAVPVNVVTDYVDEEKLTALARDCDIIIDASDNFRTRHASNRAAKALRKVLISASSVRYSVQLAVFDFRSGNPACYQCTFPEDNATDVKAAQTGVLAPVTSIAGMMAAEEALKIAAGLTPVSIGSLLILDTLSWEFTRMKLASDPDCPVCAKYRCFAASYQSRRPQ